MSYKSSINTGLPNIPESPDPKFFSEFSRIYNAIRNLALALDSYTGALKEDPENYASITPSQSLLSQRGLRLYGKASQPITYGEMISLHNDGSGQVVFRLSCALSADFRPMHGWCSTPDGIAAEASGEIMLGGLCDLFAGLTPGSTYYLGNSYGNISGTAGQVSQKLGYALNTSCIFFQPQLI